MRVPNIYLTRGIPASGKSTFAENWVREAPEKRVRVCRDNLRAMLFGTSDTRLDFGLEVQVTEAERAIALTALQKGRDVIVDAMNLNQRWVKQWFKLGFPVHFISFPVTLDMALERNRERGGKVPEDVIEKLFRRYALDEHGSLPEPPRDLTVQGPQQVEYDESLPDVYIFDIDGTLAHIPEGGRSPYDYSRVPEDVVDEAVLHLAESVVGQGLIFITSGRDEECREETEEWLLANHVPFDKLLMRPNKDGRKDATVKMELFDKHIRGKYNVRFAVDDREQVVNMWRSIGIKCFQPERGYF